MKTNRILSNLLAVSGLAAAVISICIVIVAKAASPVMVRQPVAAVERAEEMMSAACSGDYETVSAMLYGNPSLGAYPENGSPAVDLLWAAFSESLEFEVVGDCYAGDSGVTVDMKVRSLDITGVIDGLEDHAQALLSKRMERAENTSEIYDEDNNFRQEIIADVLWKAMLQSLEENKTYQEQIISLNLVFDRGEWWVMPDAELLKVLSGSVSS